MNHSLIASSPLFKLDHGKEFTMNSALSRGLYSSPRAQVTSHWVNDNNYYINAAADRTLCTNNSNSWVGNVEWKKPKAQCLAWKRSACSHIRKKVSRIHRIKANNSWQEVQDTSQEYKRVKLQQNRPSISVTWQPFSTTDPSTFSMTSNRG